MSCTAIFFSSLLELGGIRVTLSVGDYRLHEKFEPGAVLLELFGVIS
jgi:hypothetical protein